MKWKRIILLVLLTNCAVPPVEDTEEPQTIENIPSPAVGNASLSYLTTGDDGNLYISWVEKGDSNWVDFKYARLENSTWSDPISIASGDNWFVNWADYPMIAVDSSGNMMAHYLEKSSGGTYSYDVKLVMKSKDSSGWSKSITPHRDGTDTEHGFVTMLPNNNGSFTIAWLDGRKTKSAEHDTHEHGGSMSLRSATVNLNGTLSNEVELDGRVCDCCQTGGAMTAQGAIFVYRDRSVDEVRDMAFVNQNEDSWASPKLVAMDNWKIDGCPVNGPRMAASDSTVAVAWFTGALNQGKVKVAFKTKTKFDEAIIVDSTSPIGRVDVVMINDQSAVVSWLDGGDTPAIKYRLVNKNGSMSSAYQIAPISIERSSGFPQMEFHRGKLYFAWTKIGKVETVTTKAVKL